MMNQPCDCRLNVRMRQPKLSGALCGILVLLLSSLFVCPCQAGLAYCALLQGRWRVCTQADLVQPAKVLDYTPEADADTPALAKDDQDVAFEVQGHGVYRGAHPFDAPCQAIGVPAKRLLRPAWDPRTDGLVAVKYEVDAKGEDADIFTVAGAPKRLRPLVVQTGIQDFPNFSPDGRFLAYTSSQTISLYRGGVQVIQQIWIMDLQTGIARQWLLGNAQDTHPDWSPLEQQIAFASDRTGQFEIWVARVDGSDCRQLTSGPGAKTFPAWSGDAKALMFTMAHEGRYSLWIVDADGSNLRRFEPAGLESDVQLRDADWR